MVPRQIRINRIILILTAINFTLSDVQIKPIKNHFLPLKLGNGRIIYNKHTFLHYIDLRALTEQITHLGETINTLVDKIDTHKDILKYYHLPEFFLEGTKREIINKFSLLEDKLKNLMPLTSNKRQKRGLFNAVGTIHKWLFGNLDADDGNRYDEAIKALQNNEENLHDAMENQISLSTHIIEKFNKTISDLYSDQMNIKTTINQLIDYYSELPSALGILGVSQQILSNCHTYIEFIDQVYDAIIFAKLNSANPVIIDTQETAIMMDDLHQWYPKESIILFKNILSAYLIMGTQVIFSSDKIIFAIHIPLIIPNEYTFIHLLPIPQNESLYVPTQPYVMHSQNRMLVTESICPQVEDVYFCTSEDTKEDPCATSILQGEAPNQCMQFKVQLSKTIVQRIENNIIVVPSKPERIETTCSTDIVTNIQNPSLIEIENKDCSVKVSNLTFKFSHNEAKQKLLILPEIEVPELSKPNPIRKIKLIEPNFQAFNDLKKEIHHLEPLAIPDHSFINQYLSFTLIAALMVITLFIILWYKCCGCKGLPCPSKKHLEEKPQPELETLSTTKGPENKLPQKAKRSRETTLKSQDRRLPEESVFS